MELLQIPVSQLRDHPKNPRVIMREDVVDAIAAQLQADGQFSQKHALHVRPIDGDYEILAGHHRKAAAIEAAKEKPLPLADQEDLPRNPSGRKGKESDNNVIRLRQGNDTSYTLRRLARDAPELLAKIEAGEMNVNQAAIAAGIRKKLSNAEKAVAAFRRSENRLEPLKLMVGLLEPYELAVLRDWCIERLY